MSQVCGCPLALQGKFGALSELVGHFCLRNYQLALLEPICLLLCNALS